jgi:hypothetical protein
VACLGHGGRIHAANLDSVLMVIGVRVVVAAQERVRPRARAGQAVVLDDDRAVEHRLLLAVGLEPLVCLGPDALGVVDIAEAVAGAAAGLLRPVEAAFAERVPGEASASWDEDNGWSMVVRQESLTGQVHKGLEVAPGPEDVAAWVVALLRILS